MRLPTQTCFAVVLAVVIATSFAQCVAHGSGSSDPTRNAGRASVQPADAAHGGDPAPPHDPSAAPKLRCPSGLGLGRASDQPPGTGGRASPGDAPVRLLSCR